MFESIGGSAVQALDARGTVAEVRTCLHAVRRSEACTLQLAAHWADLHAPETIGPGAAERALPFGGDGTPAVSEFAAGELGPEIGLSLYQARALIADALDLRHRLPRIWSGVLDLRVEVWRARFVARRTRELSQQAAAQIDQVLADSLESVPWSRFTDVLAAEILRADPDRARRLAELARRSRFVQTGHANEAGVKSVYARLDAADAIWLDGMVDRLAEILSQSPGPLPGVPLRDARTKQEWRAVALGLLGKPLLAAKILIDHEQPHLLDEIVDASGTDPCEPDRSTVPAGHAQACRAVDRRDAVRRGRALRRMLNGLDPARLGSPAVLHVHVAQEALTTRPALLTRSDSLPGATDAVARVEGLGPTLLSQIRDWLGPGCRVRMQPIVDPGAISAVDSYEIPHRVREALFARTPASVFPYSADRSRGMDLDHTSPFTPGVKGQTGLHNLGPMGRAEHRFKTHGRVSVRQPMPGSYVWRTRFGRTILTDATGTHDLGTGTAADAVWRLAQGAPAAARSAAMRSGPRPQRRLTQAVGQRLRR